MQANAVETINSGIITDSMSSVIKYKAPLAVAEYKKLCALLRAKIIEMSHESKAPHLASALSCIDMLAVLYGNILNVSADKANDPMRDRFIFSKGHAASALYAVLAFFGFFDPELLHTYAKEGTVLAEQPGPACQPGVELATGSLGHGLPVGAGMALAAKMTNQAYKIFVLMGDGEINEGSVWEAAMFAAAHKLNNLVAIIDFNKWQATGRSEEIMALNPLAKKWEAFGWQTYEIDGHNIDKILKVLNSALLSQDKPVAIIAHTIKGKGISFMEDDNNWHYRIPTAEELVAAKKELGIK